MELDRHPLGCPKLCNLVNATRQWARAEVSLNGQLLKTLQIIREALRCAAIVQQRAGSDQRPRRMVEGLEDDITGLSIEEMGNSFTSSVTPRFPFATVSTVPL